MLSSARCIVEKQLHHCTENQITCNDLNDTGKLLTIASEAFNLRDIDSLLRMMHSNVIWPNGMEGGTLKGHDEIRGYWTNQWTKIDPVVEPIKFSREDDGRVNVTVHQVVKDLSGNVLVDHTVQHIYQIKHGLITTMDINNQ